MHAFFKVPDLRAKFESTTLDNGVIQVTPVRPHSKRKRKRHMDTTCTHAKW